MADAVVISPDERGFWHADMWRGASEWGRDEWEAEPSPDSFFTTKRGASLEEVRKKAAETWPDAEIRENLADDENEDCDD